MAFELVRVAADGVLYEGWETIEIRWHRSKAEIQFTLTTTEISPPGQTPVFDKWHFPPGTYITIYAGDDILMEAQVITYAPQADADQHSITVTGATVGWTFSTSSIDPRKFMDGRVTKVTDAELAQLFASASCNRIVDYTQPDLLPIYQIKQGATYYQELMRILQQRGKTLMGQPDGSIAVVNESSWIINSRASLVQGLNILRMSAVLDARRVMEFLVMGQNPIGTMLAQHIQPFAEFSSNPLNNCLTRVIIDQAITTAQTALRRAQWEALRTKGANTKAIITTPGWRHQGGLFWSVNEAVYVNAPWLQIDCTMGIESIIYRQNSAVGTIAEITLIDPWVLLGSTHEVVIPRLGVRKVPDIPNASSWECNSGPAWSQPFWAPYFGRLKGP